jgi:hypothetical protein
MLPVDRLEENRLRAKQSVAGIFLPCRMAGLSIFVDSAFQSVFFAIIFMCSCDKEKLTQAVIINFSWNKPIILKGMINLDRLSFLELSNALIHPAVCFDANHVAYFRLPESPDPAKRLLLDRVIPPRVDNDDPVRASQIQAQGATFESHYLERLVLED